MNDHAGYHVDEETIKENILLKLITFLNVSLWCCVERTSPTLCAVLSLDTNDLGVSGISRKYDGFVQIIMSIIFYNPRHELKPWSRYFPRSISERFIIHSCQKSKWNDVFHNKLSVKSRTPYEVFDIARVQSLLKIGSVVLGWPCQVIGGKHKKN